MRAEFIPIQHGVIGGSAACAIVGENATAEQARAGFQRHGDAGLIIIGNAVGQIIDHHANSGIAVGVGQIAGHDFGAVGCIARGVHRGAHDQCFRGADGHIANNPQAVRGIVAVAVGQRIIRDVGVPAGQQVDHRNARGCGGACVADGDRKVDRVPRLRRGDR